MKKDKWGRKNEKKKQFGKEKSTRKVKVRVGHVLIMLKRDWWSQVKPPALHWRNRKVPTGRTLLRKDPSLQTKSLWISFTSFSIEHLQQPRSEWWGWGQTPSWAVTKACQHHLCGPGFRSTRNAKLQGSCIFLLCFQRVTGPDNTWQDCNFWEEAVSASKWSC